MPSDVFQYHVGLDSRLGSGLAVARFNLFLTERPPSGDASQGHRPHLERVVEHLFLEFPIPRFSLFFDFHDVVLARDRMSTEGWNSSGVAAWLDSEPRKLRLPWHESGQCTSLHVTGPAGFWAASSAAAAPFIDGTVFFRVQRHESERDRSSAIAAGLRSVSGRSEEQYVALLPLFFAVGVLECQSCALSVMSRSTLLGEIALSARDRLGARLSDASAGSAF